MLRAVRFTLLILGALAAAGCARNEAPELAAATQALSPNEDSHLLLTVELTSSGLKVIDTTVVQQPLPKLRVPEPNPWVLELRDGHGAVTFKTNIPAHNQRRGEFEQDGVTQGAHTLLTETVFQVRVPARRGQVVLHAPRKSLSKADPRSEGQGDDVEVGRFDLP